MDENGDLVFSDRQAQRMERAMASMEFGFGEGGYQASEFIKRYLPQGFFDLLVCDEGHEYKGSGSAQGQAMGVLAAKARRTLLLTGTLMGGYADDLFALLFRTLTGRMIEDGYRPSEDWQHDVGCDGLHARTRRFEGHLFRKHRHGAQDGRGTKITVRTVKAPRLRAEGHPAMRAAVHCVPETQGHWRQRASSLRGGVS